MEARENAQEGWKIRIRVVSGTLVEMNYDSSSYTFGSSTRLEVHGSEIPLQEAGRELPRVAFTMDTWFGAILFLAGESL